MNADANSSHEHDTTAALLTSRSSLKPNRRIWNSSRCLCPRSHMDSHLSYSAQPGPTHPGGGRTQWIILFLGLLIIQRRTVSLASSVISHQLREAENLGLTLSFCLLAAPLVLFSLMLHWGTFLSHLSSCQIAIKPSSLSKMKTIFTQEIFTEQVNPIHFQSTHFLSSCLILWPFLSFVNLWSGII